MKIGLSDKFISFVKTIYSSVKAKIRHSLGESEYFHITNSVLQGESLSSKLFTLFIEDLVNILENSGIASIKMKTKDIHLLLYADDIILLAYNVFDLQEKINIIKTYLEENDLSVNLDKTKIVVFRQGNYRFIKPLVYWGDSVLEVVEKYVYLGVPFYGNMDDKRTVCDIIAKSTVAEKQLYSVFYKAKIYNFDSRMKLFSSLIESILLYSSQPWAISKPHRLRIFQMSFLRKMFHLPDFVPTWFITLETNVTPIEVIFVKKSYSFG
jgi:hypothetical protein